MKYIRASIEYAEEIYQLVQKTIFTIYPKYYPKQVVEFFCNLHNKENIVEDIKNGHLGILLNNEQIIGTGSYIGNHITRVYVLPSFQEQGYGSYIMNCLENEIARKYDTIYLEASLSACCIYENRGYKTIKHEKCLVEDGVVLVYEIMEKHI